MLQLRSESGRHCFVCSVVSLRPACIIPGRCSFEAGSPALSVCSWVLSHRKEHAIKVAWPTVWFCVSRLCENRPSHSWREARDAQHKRFGTLFGTDQAILPVLPVPSTGDDQLIVINPLDLGCLTSEFVKLLETRVLAEHKALMSFCPYLAVGTSNLHSSLRLLAEPLSWCANCSGSSGKEAGWSALDVGAGRAATVTGPAESRSPLSGDEAIKLLFFCVFAGGICSKLRHCREASSVRLVRGMAY